MYFDANKTTVEIIKVGAFGGTYFWDIYSGVNRKWKWVKKYWSELLWY